MSKLNMFAVFGILFLSSILFGNGMNLNSVSIFSQQENEAEVETDIEQENKCKKDTECKNENELNNQLSITNITQIQTQTEESQTTLNVIKEVLCYTSIFIPDEIFIPTGCPDNLLPENFQITVTRNNPSPSEFSGSSDGTLVTIASGEYSVSEVPNLPFEVRFSAEFSGDCTQSDTLAATGSIEEGQQQQCKIINRIVLPNPV